MSEMSILANTVDSQTQCQLGATQCQMDTSSLMVQQLASCVNITEVVQRALGLQKTAVPTTWSESDIKLFEQSLLDGASLTIHNCVQSHFSSLLKPSQEETVSSKPSQVGLSDAEGIPNGKELPTVPVDTAQGDVVADTSSKKVEVDVVKDGEQLPAPVGTVKDGVAADTSSKKAEADVVRNGEPFSAPVGTFKDAGVSMGNNLLAIIPDSQQNQDLKKDPLNFLLLNQEQASGFSKNPDFAQFLSKNPALVITQQVQGLLKEDHSLAMRVVTSNPESCRIIDPAFMTKASIMGAVNNDSSLLAQFLNDPLIDPIKMLEQIKETPDLLGEIVDEFLKKQKTCEGQKQGIGYLTSGEPTEMTIKSGGELALPASVDLREAFNQVDASTAPKVNKGVVNAAVEQDPSLLVGMNPKVKALVSKDTLSEAIRKHPALITEVDPMLVDPEVIAEIVTARPAFLMKYVPVDIVDPKALNAAVLRMPSLLRSHVDPALISKETLKQIAAKYPDDEALNSKIKPFI